MHLDTAPATRGEDDGSLVEQGERWRAAASDDNGLDAKRPLPRIATRVARGVKVKVKRYVRRASDARVAGARAATAGGLIGLLLVVSSGRPTASSASASARHKTRDGRADDRAPPPPSPFPGVVLLMLSALLLVVVGGFNAV